MMKIVLDAMGGDFAPKVNVDGAIDALREFEDIEVLLVGPQALLEQTIGEYAFQETENLVNVNLLAATKLEKYAFVNGKAIGAGQGRSKKEAEQAAAKAAVLEMEKKHG